MKRLVAIIAFAIVLPGCDWAGTWQDTTGQGRGDTEAKADYENCYRASGLPASDAPRVTSAAANAGMTKLKACMADQGWELVEGGRKA